VTTLTEKNSERPARTLLRSSTARRGHLGRSNRPLTILLILASLTVLAPLYVTIAMAFKTS
jgi:raffinose/stachyose/melibiose transport system permease protein